MAVRPPTKDELVALAGALGMNLTDVQLDTYTAVIGGAFASYDAVEELYAQIAPEAPDDRESVVPEDAREPATV